MVFYPFNDIWAISLHPCSSSQLRRLTRSSAARTLSAGPKEFFILPDCCHVDSYDRVNVIPAASYSRFSSRALTAARTDEPSRSMKSKPASQCICLAIAATQRDWVIAPRLCVSYVIGHALTADGG